MGILERFAAFAALYTNGTDTSLGPRKSSGRPYTKPNKKKKAQSRTARASRRANR